MTSVHLFFGWAFFLGASRQQRHLKIVGRQHRGNLKNQVDTLERLYLEKAIVSLLSDIGRVWIALRFTGVYVAPVQKTRFVDLIRWTRLTTFIHSSRGRSLITEPFCFNLRRGRTETQSWLCRKTASLQIIQWLSEGSSFLQFFLFLSGCNLVRLAQLKLVFADLRVVKHLYF